MLPSPITRLGALAILLLLQPAVAQDDSQPAIPADQIHFEIDDQGRVCVFPDPLSATDQLRPLCDPFADVMQNLGVFGTLGLFVNGSTDVVGMTDADRFFERLGGGDGALLQALQTRPGEDPAWKPLVQRVAIEACAARRFRPALGVLERLADNAELPADVRRAARDAIARIQGEATARTTGALRPLAAVLAESPAACNIRVVIDRRGLPRTAAPFRWARLAGMAVTRQAIAEAGGEVTPAMWAGAVRLAEAPGTLGYAVARTFGNHQVFRTVLTMHLPDGFPFSPPSVWLSVDGRFDLSAMRRGLDAVEVACAATEDSLSFLVGGGPTMVVTANRAVLSLSVDDQDPTLGADAAAAQVATLPAAPITADLSALDADRLGAPAELVPETLGLTLPLPGSPQVILQARMANANIALAAQAQLQGALRLVEQQIDAEQLPAELLPLLEGTEITLDGADLRVRIDVSKFDLEPLLPGLIEVLR